MGTSIHLHTWLGEQACHPPHFQEHWDEFDKLKEHMFKESRDMWKRMDTDFRKLRCTNPMLALEGEEDGKPAPLAKYEDGWMFPRKWMMPALNNEVNQLDLFGHGSDHEVIRFVDNVKKMVVSLDTSHYRPDELHVHVDDHLITIDGKHDEWSADHKKHLIRRFQRKYSLPAGANSHDVSSNLSSDGVLVVRAIKHKPASEVQITQTD